MSRKEQPITIVVAGPVGSGKTAIVGLIAKMLQATAQFPDVKIMHPEEMGKIIEEKIGALLNHEMDQVLDHPIEIFECGGFIDGQDGGLILLRRDLAGHVKIGNTPPETNTPQ